MDVRDRMQIFKVHDRVLLSHRLSQVANSCSRDSDLFNALPGRRGDRREGGKSGEDRWARVRKANGGKGGPRGPVALFTITRVSLSPLMGPIGGAVLENSFLLRENLIRSAVGPRALDLKLLLRGAPPLSFFPPRAATAP